LTRLPRKLARQPSPTRQWPEAKPIADGQGEAARGTSGQGGLRFVMKKPIRIGSNAIIWS